MSVYKTGALRFGFLSFSLFWLKFREGNMKRTETKLLIMGLILLMLSACTQPEDSSQNGNQTDVIAYVKSTDEIDL